MSKEQYLKVIAHNRETMKGYLPTDLDVTADQEQGISHPPCEKRYTSIKNIVLTKNFESVIKNNDFFSLLTQRISKRKYTDESLTLDELSFLLYATQGIKETPQKESHRIKRTVPSAGCRHPFETYLFINHVEGLEPGVYHYLPLEHELEYLSNMEDQQNRVSEAFLGQTFLGSAPVGFVWTVIPYRSEWRYTTKAQKYTLLDAGHVMQNLYLACEAIHCGTCAIAAYEQEKADALLGLCSAPSTASDNEFVIYAASVGKIEV